MIPGFSSRRSFADLSEREVLALAISAEEDDARICRSYGERLRKAGPAAAAGGQGDLIPRRADRGGRDDRPFRRDLQLARGSAGLCALTTLGRWRAGWRDFG